MRNKTMAQFGAEELVWRLFDEFMAFPVFMGWFKKVDLMAPTPASKAQARARGVAEAVSTGAKSDTSDAKNMKNTKSMRKEQELDLSVPGVRLCVPAYASCGNILEVSRFGLRMAVR